MQCKLDQDGNKAGLCIVSSCTKPQDGELIQCSTSPQKMALCFEEKLGYSLYEVKDLSILHLEKLLNDLGNIQIPSTCNKGFRFFFFFFGHGTANEICLSDGNIEKSVIISQLQKIHKDKFKIVFFDSCQTVPQDESSSVPDSVPSLCDLEVTMEKPIQVVGSLPGHSQCVDVMQLPFANRANTLVICTTDFRGSAYYCVADRVDHPEMKGSGLATYFFTLLAPTINQPLSAVLAEVRKEVDAFLKKESCKDPTLMPQLLVYDHRLMGSVNLLAESKGTGNKRKAWSNYCSLSRFNFSSVYIASSLHTSERDSAIKDSYNFNPSLCSRSIAQKCMTRDRGSRLLFIMLGEPKNTRMHQKALVYNTT